MYVLIHFRPEPAFLAGEQKSSLIGAPLTQSPPEHFHFENTPATIYRFGGSTPASLRPPAASARLRAEKAGAKRREPGTVFPGEARRLSNARRRGVSLPASSVGPLRRPTAEASAIHLRRQTPKRARDGGRLMYNLKVNPL
jgi:hypothetical protein